MTKPRSKKARRFACLATSMSLCAAALGAAREVHAEPYVVLSPEGLFTIRDTAPKGGLGGAATVGLGLDLEPLLLAPELSLSAHALPNDRSGEEFQSVGPGGSTTAPNLGMYRALVGARVGITASVEPSLYARVGVGLADSSRGGESSDFSASGGVALDLGLALDVRLSRDLTLGGQLGYAGLAALGGQTGSVHAIDGGGRVGFWF